VTDRLDLLDYYTLLGLEPTATSDDVRRAFHAFALKFHPDNHMDGDAAKLARATQIFRRGAEAYRVLLDPQTRARYDAGLREGKLRLQAGEGDARRSRGSGTRQKLNRKAHTFFRKAEQAMKRQDWSGAKLSLKIALQHDPGNALVEAKLAEVQAAIDAKKKR